ncbi:uncharacterized protein PV09_03050 [Verruconis gallopava]|uniref:NAD(P)-binding protein n=1 Tax=Verruconis gallopava TaxID=253628 RepID=A0A0D1YYS3_9PEZI|nr:uncharacterized protein PV09_03050 [Verruconis gallopava]KIW05847.1 hypothetical protein PV09_03050 [Verruconis gallopava]
MSAQARKENEALDLTGKTAVVAGGSQGIGAGVAVRFAQAGANVILVGRSRDRLEKTISDARRAARSADQKLEYISADLSLVSGVRAAAEEIKSKSDGSVDFLVQTQGGTPNGIFELTAEGIESHFAVQVLSRFLLNYLLASSGVLKSSSVNIMAPGGSQTEFNLVDLELASFKESNRYVQLGKHIGRDGVITDAYTKALQSRFPQISFFHISPGLVQTDVMTNQNVPFPLKQIATYILFPIASRTFGYTVQSYADLPVFLAANPAAEKIIKSEGFFLTDKNKKVSVSPYALDKKNQTAVFEKLLSYLPK